MIFHSFDFILFFLAIFSIYWLLPSVRGQNIFLLLGSYFFYGYIHPWFVSLLLLSTAVDYLVGRGIEKYRKKKKLLLMLSICVNMGVLAFFKYFNFFYENIHALLYSLGFQTSGLALNVILPVGISFYTFQTLSYTIDVYRGRVRAVKSMVDFAVFVGFFPQLVAGPIERAGHIIPQIQRKRSLSFAGLEDALALIIWGFVKKLVIADNVAVLVNKIFSLENPSFPLLWLAVFAFGVQIYADFSAYTDIARGIARLLGFKLRKNFNFPYLSKTPSEFWRRWHISLSDWIRDYIYIPLGGSKNGNIKTYRNILVAFLLSGLWHGASWNFVLWGGLWGMGIVIEKMLSPMLKAGSYMEGRMLNLTGLVLTFIFIHIGWLLFRADDLSAVLGYLSLSPFDATSQEWLYTLYLFVTGLLIYMLPLVAYAAYENLLKEPLKKYPSLQFAVHHSAYFAQIIMILVLHSTTAVDFIYFQF